MAVAQELKLPNTIEELLEFFHTNRETLGLTDNEVKLIWMAYNFARAAHEGQFRESGEPYIIHPLNIAKYLIEMGFDAETIAAALLHDVAEDTTTSIDQIREQFGPTIAALVDGVTKLSKYDLPDKSKRDAQAIRKLFLAMISDARVIVIKLADRLHNLQTLDSVSEERKKAKALETLEIYAPIAERLGIWQIKGELEDLSFYYLDPNTYNVIAQGLQKSVGAHEQVLNQIIQKTVDKMLEMGFQPGSFEVTGRRKYIYSIYKKMQTPKYEGQGIDRIYDKLGVRVIVQTIPDCYAVLGLIHSQWSPIPGEIDDYIGMRLPSGYQSLHTTVKYGTGKNDVVEFQIRTYQMHKEAEYGIAAHWLYKEKSFAKRDAALEQKIKWMRQMLEEPQSDDPESFVSVLKTDILQDRVYVFTPNGDIIDLPVGSTPIDFAYSVHTDIGHRCRGAKVNGKLVPLDYVLKTGDQVTILTAKHGGPSRDWLNPNLGLVATQRAKAKIRQWFKRQDREQNLTQGKSILDKEFHRLGLKDFDLNILLQASEYKSIEDLYVALGCGDISLKKIISTLSDVDKEKEALLERTSTAPLTKDTNGISVLGVKGLLTSFARCCNPAPGDDIVGYITRGRGATIHRRDCPNILRLREQDRERLVAVSWGEPLRTYPVAVEIKAYDRQGLMGDISGVLKEESVNIQSVEVKVNHNLATINLILEIGDIAQLSKVLTRIENLPNVMESHRIRPG